MDASTSEGEGRGFEGGGNGVWRERNRTLHNSPGPEQVSSQGALDTNKRPGESDTHVTA